MLPCVNIMPIFHHNSRALATLPSGDPAALEDERAGRGKPVKVVVVTRRMSFGSSYRPMQDPVVAGSGSFVAGNVFTKFCTFGVVTSKTWSDTYLIIQDGHIRLYDSEETYRFNPANYVLEVCLDSKHQASETKSKDYSQDSFKQAIINYMYLQVDNGIWAPYRVLKIGAADTSTLDKLRAGIAEATRY